MSRAVARKPAAEAPDRIGTLDWPALMDQALTLPGSVGGIYNRFYSYSFGNMMLLAFQGVKEPVNTYGRWKDMGRQVLRGSKAKAIYRPVIINSTNEAGNEETRLKGFKLIHCLFTASETTGDELPPAQPRTWDKAKALGALSIKEVPFTHMDGNIQGVSWDRNVAVNPVAAYTVKTLFHELSHIVLNHTTSAGQAEYQTHRGAMEFGAEGAAFLCMNELELTQEADMSESWAYLQSWLQGSKPDDRSIRRVFNATDQILKAGWVEPAVEGEA